LTRILRSPHLVKLGNLPNFRIRIERINSIELKFDSTITLVITTMQQQIIIIIAKRIIRTRKIKIITIKLITIITIRIITR